MYNSSKWQLLLLLQLPETFSKLIFVLFPPSKYLLSVSTFCSTTFMAIFLRRKIKRIKLSWMAYLIVVISSTFILTTISREFERVQMIFVFMKLLSFLRRINTNNEWFVPLIQTENLIVEFLFLDDPPGHLILVLLLDTIFRVNGKNSPSFISLAKYSVKWNQSTILCVDLTEIFARIAWE